MLTVHANIVNRDGLVDGGAFNFDLVRCDTAVAVDLFFDMGASLPRVHVYTGSPRDISEQ